MSAWGAADDALGRRAGSLKLATNLVGKGDVYMLDEQTTALDLADLSICSALLDRLVERR